MSEKANEQPDYDRYTQQLIQQYNEIAQLAAAWPTKSKTRFP